MVGDASLPFSVPESVPNSKTDDKSVFDFKIKPYFQDKREEILRMAVLHGAWTVARWISWKCLDPAR